MTDTTATRIVCTLSPEADDGFVDDPPRALIIPVTDQLMIRLSRAVNALVTGDLAQASLDVDAWGYGSDSQQAILDAGMDGALMEGDPLGLATEAQVPLDLRRFNLDLAANNAVFAVAEVTRGGIAHTALLNLTDLLGLTPDFGRVGPVVATEGFEGLVRQVRERLAEEPTEDMLYYSVAEEDTDGSLHWKLEWPSDVRILADLLVPGPNELMALALAEPEWLTKGDAEWEPWTDQEPPLSMITMLHEAVRQTLQRRIEDEIVNRWGED